MKAGPVEREYAAITAEAALAASALLAALPGRLPFAAPLAAAALMLRALPTRIPRAKDGCATFVPDPAAPDFKPLLSAISDSLESVQAGGPGRSIILAPMPDPSGGFCGYSVSWYPERGLLSAAWKGGAASMKCAANVRVGAPLPIEVGKRPLKLSFAKDARTGGATISLEGARCLMSLATGRPPGLGYIAYLLYLCPALCLSALNVGRMRDPLTLFVVSAAPLLAVRLLDFTERISRFARRNAAFSRLLFRRFLGRDS